MSMEIVRTHDLLVRLAPGGDRQHCVVTFDSYTDARSLDRPGFGESFSRERGITAIHVISRDNDWYQHPEMTDALAAIRLAAQPFPAVMSYGSSMGAYAAIRFAEAVGAARVLALSPQYSRDPARVGFERRWSQDAHRIVWRKELDGGAIRGSADIVVAYDPTDGDRMHVDLIETEVRVRRLPVPYAGHPVGGYLQDCGLLAGIVLDHLHGRLDHEAAAAEARARRAASPSYLGTLSERQPTWRPRLALALARLCIARSPGSAPAHARLGGRLLECGRPGEAVAAFEQALTLSGRLPVFLHHYSRSLYGAGRTEEALRAGAEALEALPAIGLNHHWMAWMLFSEGRFAEAEPFFLRSIALEPNNESYAQAHRLAQRRAAWHAFRRDWLGRLGRWLPGRKIGPAVREQVPATAIDRAALAHAVRSDSGADRDPR